MDKIEQIQKLIWEDKINEAEEYCVNCLQKNGEDKELLIYYLLFQIRNQELQKQERTIFDLSKDLTVLNQHYHALKFLVRRLEQEWLQADPMEVISYCVENEVSVTALSMVVQFSTNDSGAVLKKISELLKIYQEQEG